MSCTDGQHFDFPHDGLTFRLRDGQWERGTVRQEYQHPRFVTIREGWQPCDADDVPCFALAAAR
jgi:hypothetical protein